MRKQDHQTECIRASIIFQSVINIWEGKGKRWSMEHLTVVKRWKEDVRRLIWKRATCVIIKRKVGVCHAAWCGADPRTMISPLPIQGNAQLKPYDMRGYLQTADGVQGAWPGQPGQPGRAQVGQHGGGCGEVCFVVLCCCMITMVGLAWFCGLPCLLLAQARGSEISVIVTILRVLQACPGT